MSRLCGPGRGALLLASTSVRRCQRGPRMGKCASCKWSRHLLGKTAGVAEEAEDQAGQEEEAINNRIRT
ncbi:hypothetical protein NDU88_005241 [Pleurodeles waltl]|uniref:Uncharacterized protein n=1 Tax=Pleurodeles waltl TaxID=8319 RepID=A0AAV7MAM4_PLEWA|nr:hypothetical protein NDU88_005241 [Pleurodeles waltl]